MFIRSFFLYYFLLNLFYEPDYFLCKKNKLKHSIKEIITKREHFIYVYINQKFYLHLFPYKNTYLQKPLHFL